MLGTGLSDVVGESTTVVAVDVVVASVRGRNLVWVGPSAAVASSGAVGIVILAARRSTVNTTGIVNAEHSQPRTCRPITMWSDPPAVARRRAPVPCRPQVRDRTGTGGPGASAAATAARTRRRRQGQRQAHGGGRRMNGAGDRARGRRPAWRRQAPGYGHGGDVLDEQRSAGYRRPGNGSARHRCVEQPSDDQTSGDLRQGSGGKQPVGDAQPSEVAVGGESGDDSERQQQPGGWQCPSTWQ